MQRTTAVAVLLVVLSGTGSAGAQSFPPITDRDYTLDLHQGAVLGSGRIVGMGGVAVATAEGSVGTLFNPASAAARSKTSKSRWDWDLHVDWLTPRVGTDFDNNGTPQETELAFLEGLFTLGGVVHYREWGFGISGLTFTQPIEAAADGTRIAPSITIGRINLARSFWQRQISAGIGLRVGTFTMEQIMEDQGSEELLFEIAGSSLEGGVLWRPADLNIRLGASASLPVSSETVEAQECDPMNCQGYILPERAALPWQASVGFAWRGAPSKWNRTIDTRFDDQRYLILAADVVMTGKVPGGYGIEAFASGELQPSGRSFGVSPRLGGEYEWLPGRLRVRSGTYWEPSRFRDATGDDVPGRLHLTLGVDVRVWQFRLWGKDHRLQLSLTGDGAEGYGNGGLSAGFWH